MSNNNNERRELNAAETRSGRGGGNLHEDRRREGHLSRLRRHRRRLPQHYRRERHMRGRQRPLFSTETS